MPRKKATTTTKPTEPISVEEVNAPEVVLTDSNPTVKVKVLKTHNCRIAGKFITLHLGDTVQLPPDVAAVLQNSFVVSKV